MNVRALVREAGGPTAFADLSAGLWTQAQVSSWTSLAKPKGIGHALARKIERVGGKPHGWLDQQHPATQFATNVALETSTESQLPGLDIERLASAIETVESAAAIAAAQGASAVPVPFPYAMRARAIALLYANATESQQDPAQMVAVAVSAILTAIQEQNA